jgi:FAD/FMN-containing dehydrogenase
MASTGNSTKVGLLGELIGSVGSSVHLPGPDDYGHSSAQRSAYVVRCRNVDEVRLTVSAARARNLPLSVRGGGQDWVGQPTRQERLVVDLSAMRRVVVDARAKVAVVEGGATAADLIEAARPYGLAAVTSNFGPVGMAGFTLSGGYGLLTPRFGLAVDNLLSADVVLEDGSVVCADNTNNGELFWALRGGGGNFGIVTSMRIRLHSLGEVLSGKILFNWSDSQLVAGMFPSYGPELQLMLVPTWCGDRARGEQAIAQLQSLGRPVSMQVEPLNYADLIAMHDTCIVGSWNYAIENRWLSKLEPAAIETLICSINQRTSASSAIVVQHFHGAGTRVASSATAFGLRRRHFLVEIVASWGAGSEGDVRNHRQWAKDVSAGLRRDAIPGGYASLLEPDAYEQVDSAYGCNALRLRRLKKRFDPDGVFSSAMAMPV